MTNDMREYNKYITPLQCVVVDKIDQRALNKLKKLDLKNLRTGSKQIHIDDIRKENPVLADKLEERNPGYKLYDPDWLFKTEVLKTILGEEDK